MRNWGKALAFAVVAVASLYPSLASGETACSTQCVWRCDGDECGPYWAKNYMYQQYRVRCCDGDCFSEPIYEGDTCCNF